MKPDLADVVLGALCVAFVLIVFACARLSARAHDRRPPERLGIDGRGEA
jgi:hypothetical protein